MAPDKKEHQRWARVRIPFSEFLRGHQRISRRPWHQTAGKRLNWSTFSMSMGLKSAEFSIQRTVQHQHVNVPEMYQTFFLVNVFNHKTQNQTKSDLTWPDSLSRIRFANGILGLLQAFRTRPYNLVIDWCRALYLCTLMAFLSLAICPLPNWLFRASFHWPNTDQCSDKKCLIESKFLGTIATWSTIVVWWLNRCWATICFLGPIVKITE